MRLIAMTRITTKLVKTQDCKEWEETIWWTWSDGWPRRQYQSCNEALTQV